MLGNDDIITRQALRQLQDTTVVELGMRCRRLQWTTEFSADPRQDPMGQDPAVKSNVLFVLCTRAEDARNTRGRLMVT